MDAHQGFTELVVAELVEGIEVRTDGSREKDRVLGNNCESST
jgi:hypothetical protein